MNYAPEGKPSPVVQKGEFPFAAVALDHGHIYGQCKGLIEAGGELRYVYDPDLEKVEKFRGIFPKVEAIESLDAILEKDEIKLIAAAAVPSERGPLGLRVMSAGKDYFTDKTPFTTMAQLEAARKKVAETGRKYMVYYQRTSARGSGGSRWPVHRAGCNRTRGAGHRTRTASLQSPAAARRGFGAAKNVAAF